MENVQRWLARLGAFTTSVVLFRLGFELWWVGRIHEHAWVQVAVAFLYVAALAFLVLSMTALDHRRLAPYGFAVFCAALAIYATVSITIVNLRYTSDALLLVHQATESLLAGHNPYSVDLAAGYEGFAVPYYVQTPTTSGGIVTNLNYPALSVLAYLPFTAAGLGDLRLVSAAFLAGFLAVVYRVAPRHLRLLALSTLFGSSFFLAFCVSGFDVLFVFLLALSIVTWRRHPWLAMAFFGLACAVKQTAWFIAPFLLARLWLEREALQPGERAAEVAKAAWWGFVAFLAPNVPFLVDDPVGWFRGIGTPMGLGPETLVPLSQGLTVFVYTGLVRVDPVLLKLLPATVLVSFLALYCLRFQRLKDAAWVVPPVVLMFSERTLQNYFEMSYPLVLLLIVLAWTAREAEPAPPRPAPTGVPA